MSKPHPSLGQFLEPVQSANPIDIFGEDAFSYIDIAAIDRLERTISNPQVVNAADAPSRARQLIKAGDILVSTVRPNLNTVAEVGSDFDGAIASTGFCVLRVKADQLHSGYLFHWISSENIVRHLSAVATGASYPAVSDKIIKSLPIALPALKEQKRIAAILNKADSLRRKRQQAIRLADDFLRAVFLDMFGKRERNAALGDYVDVLSGFAFKSENYIGNSGARLLRGINVGIGACEWKDTAFYPQELTQDLGRYELLEGDVVLAMDRPWISDGLKCAVINKDVAGSLLVQRVARLRAKGIPCAQFVYQCLVDAEFQRHCRVTETTIPHISPTDLATYPIPKASPQELKRFAAIAAKAVALVRSGSEGNERIQSLALSLQSALLS